VLFSSMCVIWGVPYLLIKVAVSHVEPTVLVFGRTAIGAALLLPFAARRRQLRPLLSAWKPLLAYTVIELALPWLLLSEAERRLPSSLSGLLIASVPVIGALAGLVSHANYRLGWPEATGLLVGLGGVAALVGFDVKSADLGSVAEVAAVAFGYAIGPQVAARKLAHLPNIAVVTTSLALTALAYAPAAALQAPSRWPGTKAVAAVVGLGVICTALAFVLFLKLITEAGPVRATVITYVNPAVAVALGVFVLGEPLSGVTVAGFVLIIAGSFLAARGPRRAPAPTGTT